MANVKTMLLKHLPSILTGIAMVGTVNTAVLAVSATPKALEDISKAEEAKGSKLTKLETVKVAYKHYIPTAVSGALTLACIFGANRAHIGKETALAAAASFIDTRGKEYKQKVKDILGEETDRKIEEEIARDHISQNPPPSELVQLARDKESYIIWEPITEQWLTLTNQQLNWFERQLNHAYSKERMMTVNQALKMLPGAITDRPEGDMYMWWGDEDYYDFIYYNESFFGRPYMSIDLIPVLDKNGIEVYELSFSEEPLRRTEYDLDKDSQ